MPDFDKQYGTIEGPLGFPMKEEAARNLDQVVKALPKTDDFDYRKAIMPAGLTELSPGERSDVSWISSESPDRSSEVVSSRGMDASHFQKNPVVTLGHDYGSPPIGRSLWQRRVKDGQLVGIKAKTRYPEIPADWPKGVDGASAPWPPDKVYQLVQNHILVGKSIGFLPTKVHVPDEKEYKEKRWEPNSVQRVFDEWLLLEYAVVTIPCNQDAVTEAVSKGSLAVDEDLARMLGLDWALFKAKSAPLIIPEKIIPFTSLEQIEAAMSRSLASIDFEEIARKSFANAFDLARGRI